MIDPLLIVLLAPLVFALAMPWLGARLGPRVGWVALGAPLLCLWGLAQVTPGAGATLHLPWLPSLGVAWIFHTDGLALFFAWVVCGVGALVVAYAAAYLDDHYRDHGRFYTYLLLFMAAMLGTVLSRHLLTLFVAWELTGLTSFLLIGFLHEKEESRRGARMALLTTGLTGLALLAGVVLLYLATGSFDLAEITARLSEDGPGPLAGREGLLLPAFLCCFLGIVGKSAQFPLHYWLPNAMAAPTPVSAYLHSATMVKLGVFLTARLLPVFGGLPEWSPLLLTVGFGTLLLGAVLAWLAQDLKAVLAYTTVSQLGLLIGHYGLHQPGAPLAWDYLHLSSHVFYKAALFMAVGIIDHTTGTRDLRQLGGLAGRMPWTAAAVAISLASLAGLPLTAGFLSKEMLLKALTGAWSAGPVTVPLVWACFAVVTASVIKVAVAWSVWVRAFRGAPRGDWAEHFHAPSGALQAPVMLLALATVAAGVFTVPFGQLLDGFRVPGLQASASAAGELHLWHGWTLELGLSVGIVGLGWGLGGWAVRTWAAGAAAPRWTRLEEVFEQTVEGVQKGAKSLTRALGFTQPHSHLFIVLGTGLATVCAVLAWVNGKGTSPAEWGLSLGFASIERWGVVLVTGLGALLAALWRDPLRQVVALSVVGLGVTLYYVLYAAPDLALTQLLVETATLLLVLLVVLRFKRDGAENEPVAPLPWGVRAGRVALALVGGGLLGAGVWYFAPRSGAADTLTRAGDWYLEQTLPLAQGRNAVNTVVIDFRGWDTFLEITVLVIAALGCLGLLHRARLPGKPAAWAQDQGLFPVPPDPILRGVALAAFVPLNLFAGYLFLRGHNAPGGGFIAGLVSALSFLLLTFAIGVHGVRRWLRFNPMTLAVVGVLLAAGMAWLPVVRGLPLFAHGHVTVAGFYLGGPFWFDLGVYLVVVGTSLKLVLPLMKSVHALPAFVAEEEGRFAERLSEPIDLPTQTPEKERAS